MPLSRFTVVTAATDVSLLSNEELRLAAGLDDDDTSRDVELQAMAARVNEQLAIYCRIRRDGIIPPTFRVETVRDSFRLIGRYEHPSSGTLVLSRRPIVAVTSIVEDTDAALTVDTEYEINSFAGSITRLNSGYAYRWYKHAVGVNYSAGWDTVPSALKKAAELCLQDNLGAQALSAVSSGGNLREYEVPGVLRKVFFDNSTSGSGTSSSGGSLVVSDQVAALLGPYVNHGAFP